jgi:hypothetical protein
VYKGWGCLGWVFGASYVTPKYMESKEANDVVTTLFTSTFLLYEFSSIR